MLICKKEFRGGLFWYPPSLMYLFPSSRRLEVDHAPLEGPWLMESESLKVYRDGLGRRWIGFNARIAWALSGGLDGEPDVEGV